MQSKAMYQFPDESSRSTENTNSGDTGTQSEASEDKKTEQSLAAISDNIANIHRTYFYSRLRYI